MASPLTRESSESKAIPKRIPISDLSDINCPYSSTPGGTLYSTTPGGTKIVYERSFLMNMRNSPLSKTPPSWEIPASIIKSNNNNCNQANNNLKNNKYPPRKTAPATCRATKRADLPNHVDEVEQFPLEL